MPDWIAWQKGLTRKQEILQIARRLGVSRREAAAICMEVWEWADENTADGHVLGVTATMLSDAVSVPGVGEAMVDALWILEDPAGLHFVNWERWNSDSAKRRMQKAKWMQRHRKATGESDLGRISSTLTA